MWGLLMIEIRMKKEQLKTACQVHFEAIRAYVQHQKREYQELLYQDINAIISYEIDDCIRTSDWNWLARFLLADMDQLREWTGKEEQLQFDQFLRLYKNRFSAGAGKYVDDTTRYNSYSLIRNLGLMVCPYCDEEYLDVVESGEGKIVRTLELDHFFPKGRYPALALCFFNLIPSGQACNGLKLEQNLGMSPYERKIEEHTWLYPDFPIGKNMEQVTVEECVIRFHPTNGMEKNVSVLCLEERYQKHKARAHKYLKLKQQYNEQKVTEMVKAGFFSSVDEAYRVLYEEPLEGDGQPQLLTKLKHDITGR